MAEILFQHDKKFGMASSPKSDRAWQYDKIVKSTQEDYMSIDIDHSNWVPYILDQLLTGFCWAYSTTLLQAIYEYKETGRKILMSPLYTAKKGKEIDGITDSEGSQMIYAAKVATNIGIIPEEFYNSFNYKAGSLIFPNIENEDKIPHYKSTNYASCSTVNSMVRALYDGNILLYGMECPKEIYDLKNGKGEFLEFNPSGKLIFVGGHQIVVVGHYPNLVHNGHKGWFKCINSWGTSYGKNGFFYICDDMIEWEAKDFNFKITLDCMSLVDLSDSNMKEKWIEMWINNKQAYINDKSYALDSPPIIIKDRTFVPIRFISESFGADVKWDDKTKKVIITYGNNTIYLFVGQNYIVSNGVKKNIDTIPTIVNDRCMVPIRTIGEELGFTVLWGGSLTNKITILK